MVSERDVQHAVVQHARSKGWMAIKWEPPPNHGGLPDYLFFRSGNVLMIEFKAPGKKQRDRQRAVAEIFEKHGFPVHVIDDITKGKQLVT